MTDYVEDVRTRGRRRNERQPGSAEDGVFLPAAGVLSAAKDPAEITKASKGLRIADPQNFIAQSQRDAYNHLTGVLLDTNIDGVIKDEYLYLSTSLNGVIQGDDDRTYDFTVSDTFVSFTVQASSSGGDEAEGFIETDGEILESSEIGRLFHRVQMELVVKEAWRSASGLRANHKISFGNIAVEHEAGDSVTSLPLESQYGEWTIELRSRPGVLTMRYALLDTDRGVTLTRRTADAVLSDIAESCGKDPDPAVVLGAIMNVAVAAGMAPAFGRTVSYSMP